MDETLGSGFDLDDNFDFVLDTTGDLASAEGGNELQKDVAFNTTMVLEQQIGGRKTPAELEQVKVSVKSVLTADPRVQRVESISAEFGDGDSLFIETEVVTVDGEVQNIEIQR